MSIINLQTPARVALFALAYTPLFVLLAVKYAKAPEVSSAGAGSLEGLAQALAAIVSQNLMPAAMLLLCLFGFVGSRLTMANVKRSLTTVGEKITISEISSKNNEAVSYILTYLIPFVYRDYQGVRDYVVLSIILLILCAVYINSSLIVINPLLNLRYSLFEVKYTDAHHAAKAPLKTALLISPHRIEEGEKMLIKDISYKLFYAEHSFH